MFLPRDLIEFGNVKSTECFERMGVAPSPAKAGTRVPKDRTFSAKGNQARVIGVHDGWAYLFNLLSEKTEIWRCSSEHLAQMHFFSGQVTRVEENRRDIEAAAALNSEKQLKRRDELLGAIAPLLVQTPRIFESAFRSHAVVKRSHDTGLVTREPKDGKEDDGRLTATTIHSALYRYWRHGMTGDALLPRFDKIGTPKPPKGGSVPAPRRVQKVLGACPKDQKRKAAIITDEMRDLFEKMTNAHYRKKRSGSLAFVHSQITGHLQSVARIDQRTGRMIIDEGRKKSLEKNGTPTLRQYRYWYRTSGRKLRDDIARVGESRFMKDNRPTVGSSSMNLYGIGSRFEIDSTPIDVACVSDRDRRRFIGRPTLYVVIDVYSKMIVGIYLGYQDASWQAARLAIRNMVEDKMKFCNRFGLAISPEDWPVADSLPARLLADRGEFEGYKATDFVAKTGVTVENTTPYRGDMKGSVEKRFDMIHSYLKQLVPGTVTKDHAERGDADYRRQAKLSLQELTKVVIQVVLYLNNHHPLVSVHQPRDMIKDKVPPIPRDMWVWAQRSGRTELRRMGHHELEFSMLERTQATVTPDGLRFKGLYFYSADLHADDKLVRRRGRSEKVDISWDPQSTNTIWRHKKGGGYEACSLGTQSQGFVDMTFSEYEKRRYERGVENAKGKLKSAKALHELTALVNADLEKIIAESSTNLSPKSVAGAANAKAEEKILEIMRERVRTSEAVKAHAKASNDAVRKPAKPHPFSVVG